MLKFRVMDKKSRQYLDCKNLFINSDGKLCELQEHTLYERYMCKNVETTNIIIEIEIEDNKYVFSTE